MQSEKAGRVIGETHCSLSVSIRSDHCCPPPTNMRLIEAHCCMAPWLLLFIIIITTLSSNCKQAVPLD